jgi:hypothetical protein
MSNQVINPISLETKILKLEKQIRMMKQIGLLFFLIAAAIFTMGQASKKTGILETEELVIKDKVGKVRIRLEMNEFNIAGIQLFKANDELPPIGLGEGGILLFGSKSSVNITNSPGPQIELKEFGGFSTMIGTSELVTNKTGEKHITSAASINMFNKEGSVIWKAP